MIAFIRANQAKGFFRCGRHWPAEGVEVEVDSRTLAILKAERMLHVELREPAREPARDAQAPGGDNRAKAHQR